MLMNVEERKQLKINVTIAAKEAVADFSARYDMTELGVASRIYEWFGRQPEDVQKWILGLVRGDEGTGMRRHAEELLKKVPAFQELMEHREAEIRRQSPGRGSAEEKSSARRS